MVLLQRSGLQKVLQALQVEGGARRPCAQIAHGTVILRDEDWRIEVAEVETDEEMFDWGDDEVQGGANAQGFADCVRGVPR